MLDTMVDNKIFVYNAARDNNLAALKVSVPTSLLFYLHQFFLCLHSLHTFFSVVRHRFCFFCLFSSFGYNLFSQQRRLFFLSRLKQLKLDLISFVIRFDLNSVYFSLAAHSLFLRSVSFVAFDVQINPRAAVLRTILTNTSKPPQHHYISIIIRPCADVLFVFGCVTPFVGRFIRNVNYKHVQKCVDVCVLVSCLCAIFWCKFVFFSSSPCTYIFRIVFFFFCLFNRVQNICVQTMHTIV